MNTMWVVKQTLVSCGISPAKTRTFNNMATSVYGSSQPSVICGRNVSIPEHNSLGGFWFVPSSEVTRSNSWNKYSHAQIKTS